MTNLADYVFTNMPEQLSPLQTILDPITRAELDEISVSRGSRCLDLGAGGGSVTRMLSERVGPEGRVIAIDQDVHMLTPGGNVEVYAQDMSKDEPLPVDGPFQVIHGRLFSHHLPNRRQVVHQMADVLTPGGWLLLGEFIRSTPLVLAAPSEADADLFRRVMDGLYTVLGKSVDDKWGNHVHGAMLEAGLTSVRTRWHAESWVGGSNGCRLAENNVAQKSDEIVAEGLASAEDIERFTTKLMRDPAMVVRSHVFCSIRGQRPA